MDNYNQHASAYCKAAIFIWCLVGWIYAAITWHVLWLPGVLIFFPGIFVACLIAAAFFIPLWIVVKKANEEWQNYGHKKWSLLVVGTILKIGVYIGPPTGAVLYVHAIRSFMK
jgi:4-hydroxybenzoate polyprenyltransferase